MQKSAPSKESKQPFPALHFFLSPNQIWAQIREQCQWLFTENWQKQLHNNHNLPLRHLRHKWPWWLAIHSYWWSWDHAPLTHVRECCHLGGMFAWTHCPQKMKKITTRRAQTMLLHQFPGSFWEVCGNTEWPTKRMSSGKPGSNLPSLVLVQPITSCPVLLTYIQSTPFLNRAKYITQCALWD